MLTPHQLDRAIGAVVASAAGDALGASYEFQPPLDPSVPVELRAGDDGLFERAEWTDDTSMAVPILQALARGGRLDDPAALAAIVGEWIGWARVPKGIGTQTRAVLSGIRHVTEGDARAAARAVHEQAGKSAGNGSLMRTGPVALAYLIDGVGAAAALAAAARRVSELTHFETDAGDACVIWSLAIRAAILTGHAELRAAVDTLPADRAAIWHARVDTAEAALPSQLADNNAWVVGALEAAWSAITHSETLTDALRLAVRAGNDTDTVGAITGSLAGAIYGASALPAEWVEPLHGWPGDEFRVFGAPELTELVQRAVSVPTA
ncbi:ADP-ribosylglycohydrolase family protein [Gryllotalpicola reticulitermitis]|uniref:ADP-ribosylglycohydrolase family protein n=1 Tax=Gryllotalpicola reticulitermitis TaxID=1184153 RepID=A0ABV8Q8F0_9MICO